MAIIAFDPNRITDYSLKGDTDPKTIFHLKPLDDRIRRALMDKFGEWSISDSGDPDARGKVQFRVFERNREYVRFGVVGWENFNDHAGNPVEFATVSVGTKVGPRHGLTDILLNNLAPHIDELANQIEVISGLTAEQEKN